MKPFKEADLNLMVAFMTLQDLGIAKIHGDFIKMGQTWYTTEKVKATTLDTRFNLLNDTDLFLEDIVQPIIGDNIMNLIGRHFYNKLCKHCFEDYSTLKMKFLIDIDSTVYILNSIPADVIVNGESINVVGHLRHERIYERETFDR